MHGLGNDFVFLDLISQSVSLTEKTIAKLGDRHTGIGFDQLLTVSPPRSPEMDFRYRIFNADGTELPIFKPSPGFSRYHLATQSMKFRMSGVR